MSDPFSPRNSEQQLIREAKIGLSLVALVIVAVVSWSYTQYNRLRNSVPRHIQNAPIAQHVGPKYYMNKLKGSHPPTELAQKPIAESLTFDRNRNQTHAPDTIDPQNQVVASRPLSNLQVEPRSARPIKNDFPKRTERPLISRSPNQEPQTARDLAPKITSSTVEKPAPARTAPIHDIAKTLPGIEFKSSEMEPRSELAHEKAENFSATKPDAIETMSQRNGVELSKSSLQSNSFRPKESSLPSPKILDDSKTAEFLTKDPKVVVASFNDTEIEQTKPNTFQPSNKNPNSFKPISTKALDMQESASVENASTRQVESASTVAKNTPAKTKKEIKRPEDDFALPRDPNRYQTKSGDSFWSISQQVYDDGRYFSALYQHNRSSINAYDNLPLGTWIKTPPVEILHSQYPDLCPIDLGRTTDNANVYRTLQGETLFDIARKTTGQASRYLELLQRNRDRLPKNVNHLTRLSGGIELQLPNSFQR